MKKTFPLLLLVIILASCSQERKLLRKASTAVDQSNYEKALSYYDECIERNQNSFFGNAGKGIVLSEYMSRHEQAIPYLEKALANSPPDKTKPVLHGNLGRSYHFIGNYARALSYYGKLDNDPDYSDYDEFLTKRIADCKFAIEHPEVAAPENQSLVNAGNTINTDKPEYTPVLVNNQLFFTSKRQDDEKEKKNGIDGKYFESVYVADLNNGAFSQPKKLELSGGPAVKSKKMGEAVASASPDGNQLFIYKGGRLYSTATNDNSHKLELLDEKINFSKLQNHAALSPDGNTMYFTSESDKGRGGSDIFYATRQPDGSWSEAVALDHPVNTPYDEEAPFVNESGVLFFSSNGHPGYGGFDVYKTQLLNGSWTKPENLGQPVNSPGDDIFFSLQKNSSKGYMASARAGGFGDLDIYRVHYVITDVPQCQPADSILAIEATPSPGDPLSYQVKLQMPEAYKNNIRTYRWEVNGKTLSQASPSFTHRFDKADNYHLSAKLVAWCDTCPRLIGMCADKNISISNNILTSADPKNNPDENARKQSLAKSDKKNSKTKSASKNNTPAVANNTKNNDDKGTEDAGASKTNANESDITLATNHKNDQNKNMATATDNGSAGSETTVSRETAGNTGKSKATGSSVTAAYLSENDLQLLNWKNNPALFDHNAYALREDAKSVLDHNISILKENKDLKLEINGYADSRGSSAYNRNLSLKRANAVKQYLLSNGIHKTSIRTVKAHGEEQLLNSCGDNVECSEEQHQENRSVHLKVMGNPLNARTTISSN